MAESSSNSAGFSPIEAEQRYQNAASSFRAMVINYFDGQHTLGTEQDWIYFAYRPEPVADLDQIGGVNSLRREVVFLLTHTGQEPIHTVRIFAKDEYKHGEVSSWLLQDSILTPDNIARSRVHLVHQNDKADDSKLATPNFWLKKEDVIFSKFVKLGVRIETTPKPAKRPLTFDASLDDRLYALQACNRIYEEAASNNFPDHRSSGF